jgi:uncharacterized membrane protein
MKIITRTDIYQLIKLSLLFTIALLFSLFLLNVNIELGRIAFITLLIVLAAVMFASGYGLHNYLNTKKEN